jgi:hypothetical protein
MSSSSPGQLSPIRVWLAQPGSSALEAGRSRADPSLFRLGHLAGVTHLDEWFEIRR